ncbi:MAG: putative phage abortive infection protein [Rhodospirillales bacterium]|jgi:hypothetical protein
MKEQTEKFRETLRKLAGGMSAFVALFLLFGILYTKDFMDLGPWGDFVGGTLNPILASATILALLYTIYLQRQANDLQKEELVLSRNEATRSANALEGQIEALKKQNFEATFFKMLEMHNDILNSIDIVVYHMTRGDELLRGRDCFVSLPERQRNYYNKGSRNIYDKSDVIHESLASVLSKFWLNTSHELGHYYRYLYNLIKFVDAYEGDKRFYMKIIRAQLSNHELALLFYNCLSEHGEDMKPLVEKYALLKHMPDDLFLDPSHKILIAPSAFREAAA